MFHFFTNLFQLPDLLFRRFSACPGYNLRFDHQTYIKQIQCQPVTILHISKAQHIIFHITGTDDISPVSSAHFQNTSCDQTFYCLSYRTSSNSKQFRQFVFIRDLLADFYRFIQNIFHQSVFCLLSQRLFHSIFTLLHLHTSETSCFSKILSCNFSHFNSALPVSGIFAILSM